MDRRGFLKSIAAVALLATVPGASAKEANATFNRVLKQANGGIIKDEIFYIDGPVILKGLRGLTILNCQFLSIVADIPYWLNIDDCENVNIYSCVFRYK
jgi:hypothetical protein